MKKILRPQPINPLLLMNRAAHKVAQRIGPNTYLRSSGGGAEPCFYVVSAEIGVYSADGLTICFNAPFSFDDCTSSADWDFKIVTPSDPRGSYTMQLFEADPSPECLVWDVWFGAEQNGTNPLDTVQFDYTGAACRRDATTEEECLLAPIANAPVVNRVYGPSTVRIGDQGDDVVVAVFPVALATVGSNWTVKVNNNPVGILGYQIVSTSLRITIDTSVSNTDVVTISQEARSIQNPPTAVDGRECWRFFDMPVLNVVGVSFWSNEDAGPWLIDSRDGRWRLAN